MMFQTEVLCVAFLAALAFQQGSTQASNDTDTSGRLRCYDCSSFLEQQNCNNPDENTPVTVCEADETMCRKVEQHINIEGSNKVRTYRSCARTGELGKCLERTGTYEFKSWYCQCKGDKCNGAGSPLMSITLIAGMVAALYGLRSRI